MRPCDPESDKNLAELRLFYRFANMRWIGLTKSAMTTAVPKAVAVTIVNSVGNGIVS